VKNNFIKIKGRYYSENYLSHLYPMTLVKYSSFYVRVIKIIVEEYYNINKSSKLYQVYINLLGSKSVRLKNIVVILELCKKNKIEEISIDYFIPIFEQFLTDKNIVNYSNKDVQFIEYKEVIIVLPKYIINKLFTVFGYFFKKENKKNKNFFLN